MPDQPESRIFRLRPMPRRDANEAHRAATPLELLFDLVSVIAIAAAAAGLHHAVAENHATEGIIKFACAFFAIWWAWMNFTWFASAYDNDDALFRVLTMTIMSGALALAAGIGTFFETLGIDLMVTGYVIMRLAMVWLWLRAAKHDASGCRTARWYAGGIASAQLFWVAFLFSLPLAEPVFYLLFATGVVLELAVPVIAENMGNTPWHRHHIIERYGLLNIIVLGETLLAASIAIGEVFAGRFEMELLCVALSALLILFSMWWLYFSREEHLETHELSRALIWGYGHLLIFASGAAIGAGIAIVVDIVTKHAQASLIVGHYAVAIPVAVYMLGLWLVRDRFALAHGSRYVLPSFAFLVLCMPQFPAALEGIALLAVLSVVARNRLVTPARV